MAEVLSLEEARRARLELRQVSLDHAVMHPALRWLAGDDGHAHRRTRAGVTACGLSGPLTLADTDRRPCRDCYTERVQPAS